MNRTLCSFLVAFSVCAISVPGFSQIQKYVLPDTSNPKVNQKTRLSKYFSQKPTPALDYLKSKSDARPGTSELKMPELTLFGYDLFSRGSGDLAFSAAEVMVLPDQYKLGPGDRLGIYLLGTVQQNLEVIVNIEGKIFLPPAGVIHVDGLDMKELKEALLTQLAKYYDNFELDVMLLQPKNVMVAVVGDVYAPGKYVLSALNTVLDAVIVGGGPTENGSIRDVKLIRDGKNYASVDLYKFLISGDNKFDVFLRTGDRIVVPLAQSRVTVDGEVKRPSIFELKPDADEKLTDVLYLAGGLTDEAYRNKIEISRRQESGYRKLHYVNLNAIADGDSTQDIVLQNGDEINVYSKLEQIHKREVAIYGEVRKPGAYPFEENMQLSDLILKAGSLTKRAYTLEAEIAKVDPGLPTKFLKVSLEGMNNGGSTHNDIILEEDDQVFIREIPDWEVGLLVQVEGEVQFPGKYPIVKDSTYLSNILKKAGGFTEEAFLQEAVVVRPSTRIKFDKEYERLSEMSRDEMSDLEYQYLVMRQNSADVNQIVVDFEKLVFQNDKSQDVILEDGDVIIVPKVPTVVTVTGSVAKPGGVTYKPGVPLDYYLFKAGGPSWDADRGKTKVIKVSGEVIDDEDVRSFEAGDIIWVPRKSDKKFWPVFLQTVAVTAQIASIYLIIDTAVNR